MFRKATKGVKIECIRYLYMYLHFSVQVGVCILYYGEAAVAL